MQTLGSSDTPTLTIRAPALLNLACFVRDAAGLSAHQGYHLGVDQHWPYRESRFEESTDAVTFLQAGYQWQLWWHQLVEARYAALSAGHGDEEDLALLHQGLPGSLEGLPALQQAVSLVWPSFWGWWLLPYVGGKMALETVDLPRDLYTKLQTVAPGGWHWDFIYRYHMAKEIHYDGSKGWAIVHPHDAWHHEWMSSEISSAVKPT